LNIDWAKFVLHFIFGVFIGVILEIGWGIFFDIESWVDLIWLPIVIGILGGMYGDRFWEKLLNWIPWL
jgi:hypothetical protein